jgi:hypothetical protein
MHVMKTYRYVVKEVNLNSFSALDGGELSTSVQAALSGTTSRRYRPENRLGGPQIRYDRGSEEKRKSLLLPGIESPVVQPVATHFSGRDI